MPTNNPNAMINLTPLASAVVLTVGAIVIAFMSFVRYDAVIAHKAVDECMKSASYVTKTENATLTEPMKNWYTFCIKEKMKMTSEPERK